MFSHWGFCNCDLFGNEDAVLPTPMLSADALQHRLDWLIREERSLQETLARRIPQLQDQAKTAAARVSGVLA